MSDITDAMFSKDVKLRSPQGMGGLAIADGIVLIITFLVEGFLGHTIAENMGTWLSVAVVFLPLAALLIISGYMFIKNSKIGYYVGWIAAIVATALGAVLVFGGVKNDIFMDFYLLITGIINIAVLLYPATREGLQ